MTAIYTDRFKNTFFNKVYLLLLKKIVFKFNVAF